MHNGDSCAPTDDFNELGKVEIEVGGGGDGDDFESLADIVDEIVSELEDSSDDCEIVSYEMLEEKPFINPPLNSTNRGPKQTNLISFFLADKNGIKSAPTFIPEPPQASNKRRKLDASNKLANKIAKLSGGYPISSARKKVCPEYKKVPGTSFTVDAFSYGVIPGCSAYFLSHFHSDHYMGLSKKFSSSLYCTQTTANLVRAKIGLNSSCVHALSLETAHRIHGVEVVLLDANHCPGSVLFRFSTPDGKHHLHTGDFRGHPRMECYPWLSGFKMDTLLLDTTYMDPLYTFPPQDDVISHAISLCRSALKSDPNTLILVGSYLVGKERMFLGIAEALDCKICVNKGKLSLLECYDWPQLKDRLSTDSRTSRLHVVKMSTLSLQAVREYAARFPSYSAVLAIRPTGWAFKKNQLLTKIKPIKYYNIQVYDLPYSEHSSYDELRRFVKFLKPETVIPTVNVRDSKHMKTIFDLWLSEKSL